VGLSLPASIARKMGVELYKGRQQGAEAMRRLERRTPVLDLVRERPKYFN
jgi:hypothetical protein